MTAWSSRSFLACTLLLAACPGDPPPPSADGSSTGSADSTSTGTTPPPSTTAVDSTDTTASTTSPGTSSTGPDDTTGGSSSTGPDDTTGSSSSGDASTTSGSSSGDPSTTSGSSSGGSSSGDPTTGGNPCDAGDGPDFAVTNNGFSDYVINGVNDPPLTVVRGCSYTFDVNAPGHPFLIKSVQGIGAANSYNDGVVGNGAQNGVITWDVSLAAPDSLFYNCQFHAPMTGTITVIDPL